MRIALFSDIIGMAFATLRANKLRAGVDGPRRRHRHHGDRRHDVAHPGFRRVAARLDPANSGPNTLFVAKFSGLSFASGKEFKDLIKRPVLTVADAKAIEREAPSAGKVDVWLGAWGMPGRERAYYKGEKTKELTVIRASRRTTRP